MRESMLDNAAHEPHTEEDNPLPRALAPCPQLAAATNGHSVDL